MTPYNELSAESKIWIYQSSRLFNNSETLAIQQELADFTQQWAAHGKGLKAHGNVYYQQFIVLIVDENAHGASGCSIDSSVHFLKNLQQKYDVNLFDRLTMAYKNASNQVVTANRASFQKLVNTGEINDNTIVFNNLVRNKQEFENQWEIPMAQSWHKRIFKTISL
ncbi:MAG: hypothetical protein AB8B69_20710 [Chitinophagales bacterium]